METAPLRLSLFLVLLFLTVCASGAQEQSNRYKRISISISPASATVQLGHSQQFAAIFNGTGNTAVNWLVNGILGGNAMLGTISGSGSYTAPSSMPSVAIAITAQSVAYSRVYARAAITLTSPPTSVTVNISPASASVQTGQSQQFVAAVSGASNTAVNWLVSGVSGGNSAVGTISSSGFYTAPLAVPSASVSITAQSVYNPASSASATVAIIATPHYVNLSWMPNPSSVAGYNVYRSGQVGGPFVRLNASMQIAATYTDTGVQSTQTYYYATTAVGTNGVESGYSNVVQVVIP